MYSQLPIPFSNPSISFGTKEDDIRSLEPWLVGCSGRASLITSLVVSYDTRVVKKLMSEPHPWMVKKRITQHRNGVPMEPDEVRYTTGSKGCSWGSCTHVGCPCSCGRLPQENQRQGNQQHVLLCRASGECQKWGGKATFICY